MQQQSELKIRKISDGWEFYPITYKRIQYVVTIKKDIIYSSCYVNIYTYKEKATFFKKHKGTKIYSKEYCGFQYPEKYGRWLDFAELNSPKFFDDYPLILKEIFKDYKRSLLKEQRFLEWDGIIE